MKDALGQVQSVLVLGGGSDIALATCRKLVGRRGARVVLAARKPEACDDAAAELRAAGASAVDTVAFDATDFALARSVRAHDVRSLRRLRPRARRVRRARRPGTRRARRRGRARDRADQLHRRGVGERSARRARSREQGHGTLVLLSSVAGERVRRSNFVYGSSKAGVDGYYQGLAAALAGSGVHVMIVRPGFVHTKMTTRPEAGAALGRRAEQVADAIVRGIARGTRGRVGTAAAAVRDDGAAPRAPVVFRRLPM